MSTAERYWPRVIRAIAAFSILAVLTAWCWWMLTPTDDSLRRRSVAAAAEGRWPQAFADLSRIAHPTPADRLLRASAAQALGRSEQAIADLDQVPRDGPLAARRALLVGQIEQGRRRARPMEEALREAIRLDPKLSPARRLLIYLYGLQERRPELREQFQALADRDPVTIDLALHWGLSRGPIGDPAETRKDLAAFVAADPFDRASCLALAEAERRLGLFDEAADALKPWPESDPDARAIRAQIAFDRGENTVGEALLAGGPPAHAALDRLRGRRALARRDGPAAVRALKATDAAEPDNLETLFVLSQALRLAGDAAEADRVAAKAAAHQALRGLLVEFSNGSDARPETFRKIAAACEAVGFLPEAVAWYRLAISADPVDAEAQKAIYRLSKKRDPAP